VVRRWDTDKWSDKGLTEAEKVAVAPDGTRWKLTANHEIWMHTPEGWVKKNGLARDIAIGQSRNGRTQTYVIGTDRQPGGYGIYWWHAEANEFLPLGGGAVSIATDAEGLPWVTTDSGQVFRFHLHPPGAVPGAKIPQ
jgi:hypothetical protein